MNELIKDILNTLGVGINGVMPPNTDIWCRRLTQFFPSFKATCTIIGDTEREFVLDNGTKKVKLKYTMENKRVVNVEVSER